MEIGVRFQLNFRLIEHKHVKQPWLTKFKAKSASSPIDICVSSYQKRSTRYVEVDALRLPGCQFKQAPAGFATLAH